MKKLLIALIVLTGSALAQPANPGIVLVGSAPSGSCSVNLPDEQVVTLGTLYSCQSGTWTQITGGGGGGITALTQDVTASGTGSVAATVVGINDTLLSGLASGLLFNTTSTGVPSIASSAQILTACTGCAPLASPTFTGVPAAPTPSAGTNTTQLATTAFVTGPATRTTGTGFYAPFAQPIFTEAAVVIASSTSTVYCQLVDIRTLQTVTHAYLWIGTGENANADIGLYPAAVGSTLLASLGGINTTSSNHATGAAVTQGSGSVVVPPGTYYFCWTSANSSTTADGISTALQANLQAIANQATLPIQATFTNGGTAGILPNTLGTLSATTGLVNVVEGFFY